MSSTETPDPSDTLAELIARAYARGFRDGWDRPDHMTVPDELLALEEHYERMAALRAGHRVVKAKDALADEVERLRAAIERVRRRHPRARGGTCAACRSWDGHPLSYPCPTVRALDGEA